MKTPDPQKVWTAVEINVSQLVVCLADDLNHDEMLTFIKKLDEEIADWTFTKKLMDHFDSLKPAYELDMADGKPKEEEIE